jgi:hypothetical protein
MKKYMVLEIITIILVILGFASFYNDLSSGNFNPIITLYFIALAIGYFIVMHILHLGSKERIRKLAELMHCQFLDSGKYALTHKIKCEDVEVEFNLRGSYTPASMHIIVYGNFNEADLRPGAKYSRKFYNKIQRLQEKYRIRVNDAYVARDRAEAIITKFSYDEENLKAIIEEFKSIVLTV